MHRWYRNWRSATSALRQSGAAGLVAATLGLCAVLWLAEILGGDALRRAWALERQAVLDGQVWRLVTAHLVHLSRIHTILNILGLWLVAAALWSALTGPMLLRSVLWSGAAISIGWVLLQPAGVSYVGFSGITHGIYAFGGLNMLRRGPVWLGWTVLALLAVKLGHELFLGAVPGAEEEIGGKVALLAHSLGTFGGALGAAGTGWRMRGAILGITAALSAVHVEGGAAGQLWQQVLAAFS